LTIAAFAQQLIFCILSAILDNTGYIALGVISIVAHSLYYLRVFWKGEVQYKTNFFYYEISIASAQCLLLLSDTAANWPMVIPVMVQAATCYAMHNRQPDSDEQSVSSVNDGSDEDPKKWIILGLTIVACPLQLFFFIVSSGNVSQTVFLMAFSLVVHALYFHSVFMRRGNKLKLLFFYYEIGVCALLCFSAFSNSFNPLPSYNVCIIIISIVD
ncbi:hypothetical protein PENTCL1PPCAC_16111, partial [Pristionchus entomophagus]